ncbi:M50 family metallopeptidase [Cohnella thailandensis]|uniref:M50 family metallopeptidase n=1 Tax=Cohnella thailandensis TaxID=557557 RepID=A0A841SV37_9BACL|nr:M50 family metallopeptidase [Cohnella thailandensis]MBB6633925.1 M50 family metallopeptidase [Cohnella thailandensis]MBP1972608.1 stage IV sporulation protein FB [Cohnella thailandensis]
MIKWRGIAFKLHPLFVLLMLLALAMGEWLGVVTLFGIVLLHELGHLAMALRFGWTIREVKLLPFGGVLEVEEAGTVPAKEEALVAIAGPAQNAWLAVAAYLAGLLGWVDTAWSHDFIKANALILLFNLLPIMPLDGGKLVQAWMSLRIPYHRVLLWSSRLSLFFSAAVVLYSFVPLLQGGVLQMNALAVGLFLCASNWTYRKNVPFVFLRFLVHRARRSEGRIDRGTLAQPIVVAEQRQPSDVVKLLMKERYHLVYVIKQGKVQKVVPEDQLVDRFLHTLTNGHADLRFFM